MSIFSLLGCLKLKLYILTLFRVKVGYLNFCLPISFSCVKISFHVQFYPPGAWAAWNWSKSLWWWLVVLKPIQVFSLGFDQAGQFA